MGRRTVVNRRQSWPRRGWLRRLLRRITLAIGARAVLIAGLFAGTALTLSVTHKYTWVAGLPAFAIVVVLGRFCSGVLAPMSRAEKDVWEHRAYQGVLCGVLNGIILTFLLEAQLRYGWQPSAVLLHTPAAPSEHDGWIAILMAVVTAGIMPRLIILARNREEMKER